MIFSLPDNYHQLPAQLRAHWQLTRHCLLIRKESGYNNDIVDAYMNRRDFENVKNRPAVNVIWGPETVLNGSDMDRSLQTYNVRAQVFLDFILDSVDPVTDRALLKADLEKHFFRDYNYWLPEDERTGDNATAFNMMFTAITPYGDDQSSIAKLEVEANVLYRTTLGNPYERI